MSAVSQMSPNPDTMEVQMQRSYHLIDEDDTEVDKENVAQGITLYSVFLIPAAYKSLQWHQEGLKEGEGLFYEGCMI